MHLFVDECRDKAIFVVIQNNIRETHRIEVQKKKPRTFISECTLNIYSV